MRLAADPTGRRVVVAVVPTPAGHEVIVTAGLEAGKPGSASAKKGTGRPVNRMRYQIVSRDLASTARTGVGHGNSISFTGVTGRGGRFVGRFANATEAEIRAFCEALALAGGLTGSGGDLPLSNRSPGRQ